MVEGHFHWLFPSTYKSEEALEQFMRAFACPMVVTDEELSLFLDFEVSTERSPPTAQNQHHFYFRSFKLTPAQLSKLIRYMNANDDNFPEMQAWRDVLDLHANEKNLQAPEFLTIRYIGTVQGPGRPIDRYLEDITSRTSGLLSHFQQCLESLYPDVAAAATANWIKSASLEFLNRYNPADVERLLIQFFDHSTLLNRQLGGKYTAYAT